MAELSLQDLAKRQDTLEKEVARLRQVEDRQAIYDCTVRFCRGINRNDMELLRSVFHDDAIDDHGAFVGGPDDFLTWIGKVYSQLSYTQHFVMNQSIDLDGDSAHVETYWMVVNIYQGTETPIMRGGRYMDRFERRHGRWAIAARVCFTEWNGAPNPIELPEQVKAMKAMSGTNSLDRNDLSYMRPLIITREARNLDPHK